MTNIDELKKNNDNQIYISIEDFDRELDLINHEYKLRFGHLPEKEVLSFLVWMLQAKYRAIEQKLTDVTITEAESILENYSNIDDYLASEDAETKLMEFWIKCKTLVKQKKKLEN